MEFINEKTIKLDKVVNELDKFVFDFIKILEKHTKYVIVSGYVAILFGRTRGTEDVDIFIWELKTEQVKRLYEELQKLGYWCLNTDNTQEMFDYLKDGLALRFALKEETVPNFEIKFARKRLDKEALMDTLTVITGLGAVKISSIERQIAFKKYYLKSDKDLEDAKHMEKIFKEHIDSNKIEQCRRLIENEMA